jgi:hypothetical protein
MRNVSILCCIFILFTGALQAQWVMLDDFNSFSWETEEWPITRASKIQWDNTRSLTGKTSLKSSIECSGWGGAFKITNAPILNPPAQGMSVSILCQGLPGSSGMPSVKLEVYPVGGSESMGGPDTPIIPGKWTTVFLPAASITGVSSGCGIIFLKGESSGRFNIWIDSLMRDGKIWEDFEYTPNTIQWKPVNINGAYDFNIVSPGYSGMPSLNKGNSVRLAWKNDTDGSELKAILPRSLDMSSWKTVRVRAAIAGGTPDLNVSFWMFDGKKGSLAVSSKLQASGKWIDIDFDLAAHKSVINLRTVRELGIVFHEYNGNAGVVFIENIQYMK